MLSGHLEEKPPVRVRQVPVEGAGAVADHERPQREISRTGPRRSGKGVVVRCTIVFAQARKDRETAPVAALANTIGAAGMPLRAESVGYPTPAYSVLSRLLPVPVPRR